jgi:hypothetical protein
MLGLVAAATFTAPRQASAQTLTDVLSFLLINRSIPTDDFVRDGAAAAATRDAFSNFLQTELGTLPVSSSSGGFTYRFDPGLGTTVRSSNSFGPFFTERSLTLGAGETSVGVTYQHARYREIDGRNLSDGTLVATASRLQNETQPFDAETLTLGLRSDTMTLQGTVGVTDRLDVGAALPLIRLALDGQRVDTYRGRSSVQAVASGTSTGPGDLILRTKYNLVRQGASGLALGAEARLPTGDEQNLLGSGNTTITPRAIVSYEGSRAAVHGTAGYTFGGASDEVNLTGAGTFVAAPRLTLLGELIGRHVSSEGHLIETTAPHPTLAGVETIRLSTIAEPTTHLLMVAGFKWNVGSAWLLNGTVSRPLTDVGLTTGWTPTFSVDYQFGR